MCVCVLCVCVCVCALNELTTRDVTHLSKTQKGGHSHYVSTLDLITALGKLNNPLKPFYLYFFRYSQFTEVARTRSETSPQYVSGGHFLVIRHVEDVLFIIHSSTLNA